MASQRNPSQKQKNILSFIWNYQRTYNRPPSYREIEKAIGANSTAVVSHHVRRLEAMGLLSRDENVARGLSITGKGLIFLDRLSNSVRKLTNFVQIPIIGDIVAGQPVHLGHDSFLSIDEDEIINVDVSQLPRRQDNLFALRVRGRSMIDELVNDGDIVILQKVYEIRNGDMVAVWLRDREEMTLKTIYFEGEKTRLQPANPDFEPLIVPTASVDVQGKVILVQRQMISRGSYH